MKRIFRITFLLLIVFFQIVSVSNAANGGTLKLDKTEVKQGDTFEVYVVLDVVSEAYDIKFNVNDKSLIKKSEVISTVADNKLSGDNRIYLIQIAEENNRTKHPVGTKIACMKYTVADDAKVDSEIVITVKGDVVGENNSENTINAEKRIKVIKKDDTAGSTKDSDTEGGTKKPNTEANTKLPDAGSKKLYIFSIISFLLIFAIILYVSNKKINIK